jgi:hypothetical protein
MKSTKCENIEPKNKIFFGSAHARIVGHTDLIIEGAIKN